MMLRLLLIKRGQILSTNRTHRFWAHNIIKGRFEQGVYHNFEAVPVFNEMNNAVKVVSGSRSSYNVISYFTLHVSFPFFFFGT